MQGTGRGEKQNSPAKFSTACTEVDWDSCCSQRWSTNTRNSFRVEKVRKKTSQAVAEVTGKWGKKKKKKKKKKSLAYYWIMCMCIFFFFWAGLLCLYLLKLVSGVKWTFQRWLSMFMFKQCSWESIGIF